MKEAIFNDIDEHYPACNEQCHGSIHYLAPDDHMGDVARAFVASKRADGAIDVYVNGKFVKRFEDDE